MRVKKTDFRFILTWYIFKNIFKDFIDFLFPSQCMTCDNFLIKGEVILCIKCLYDISNADNIIEKREYSSQILIQPENDRYKNYNLPNNAKLNIPVPGQIKSKIDLFNSTDDIFEDIFKWKEYINPIHHKFYGKIPIKYCFSLLKFARGSKIRFLIHNLKYNDKKEIGKILGTVYGIILKQDGHESSFDIITSVPLHKKKLKSRGYNQSDFIAQAISERLSIKYDNKVIIRMNDSKSQTLMPDKWSRWENICDIFFVNKDAIKNKRVLLVDDVITTGATLEACAMELFKNGASEVNVATVAYA